MSLLDTARVRTADAFDLGLGIESRPTGFFETLGARAGDSLRFGLLGVLAGPAPGDTEAVTDSELRARALISGVPVDQLRESFADQGRLEFSQEEYRQSEFFREDIPYEPGLTPARAEALADLHDENRYREWLVANRRGGVASAAFGLAADFAGAAFDPINYIPFVGPAARARMLGRFGNIGGRVAVGSTDATLGATAILPIVYQSRSQYGDDLTFADLSLDIALSALVGAAFGGAAGGLAAYRDARLARLARDLTPARIQTEAIGRMNEAIDALVTDRPLDITPIDNDILSPLLRRETVRERLAGGTGFDAAGVLARTERFRPISRVAVVNERSMAPLIFGSRRGAQQMADQMAARLGGQPQALRLPDGRYILTRESTVRPVRGDDGRMVLFETEEEARRFAERNRPRLGRGRRRPPAAEPVPLETQFGRRFALVDGATAIDLAAMRGVPRATSFEIARAADVGELRSNTGAIFPDGSRVPAVGRDRFAPPDLIRRGEPAPFEDAFQRAISDPLARVRSPARVAAAVDPVGTPGPLPDRAGGLPGDPETVRAAGQTTSGPSPARRAANEHGVSDDGEFDELVDYQQAVEAGRIHPEDQAAFEAASRELERAQRWPDAYQAAAVCVTRRVA